MADQSIGSCRGVLAVDVPFLSAKILLDVHAGIPATISMNSMPLRCD